MKIIIENASTLPIYQQIYEQIKDAILSQSAVEGELLPSIRQLSRELKVSVITTTRAYTDLESDGYITIVQGKGCYVKALNPNAVEEQLLHDIEEHFQEIIKSARLLNKTDDELMAILILLLEDKQDD